MQEERGIISGSSIILADIVPFHPKPDQELSRSNHPFVTGFLRGTLGAVERASELSEYLDSQQEIFLQLDEFRAIRHQAIQIANPNVANTSPESPEYKKLSRNVTKALAVTIFGTQDELDQQSEEDRDRAKNYDYEPPGNDTILFSE